jgi:hypothetical protein
MISAVLSKLMDASYGTIDKVTLRDESSGGVDAVVIRMIKSMLYR